MKNLCLSQVSSKKQLVNINKKFFVGYGHPNESTTGNFFVCSETGVVSSFDCNGVEDWSTALTYNTESEGNSPVNVTFSFLTSSVSVGMSNGELFSIGDFGATCSLAGVCDNGLLSMEWSPDQEILALVTKDLKLILMCCTFEPLNEYYLLSEDFGEKQFINVGWGKKETQFHGSAGKQAAKATTAVIGDQLSCDTRIIISWRGDGNLFAVGFTMDGIRRFKIFDRDGNLQYTSELQPGLEANLSWRPSGNLIATTQKLPDKYLVSFFEKNGLKHGEFIIPVNLTTYVEDIFWSSDSEILTLLCKDTSNNTQQVLLFTSSNYHWYLKQTLCFNEEQNIAKLMWDNDFNVANNKKMHIILENGQYYAYTWKWDINHSNGKSSNDDAVVSVIDGKKLLLTAFRYTVVSPPMAGCTIDFESHINSIHFAPDTANLNSNSLFVCTNEKLVFLEQTNKNPLDYKITKTLVLESFDFPFKFYNWHWLNSETILCASIDDNNNNEIIQFNLSSETLTRSSSQLLPSALTHFQSNPLSATSVYLQLDSGDILQYNSDNTIIPQTISLPETCPKFSVLSVDNDIYFLGLSYKGYLYKNDKLVLNNVNSFYVHSNYLLLTTLKHTLLCIELTTVGLNLIETYDKSEISDIYKRKIERGAKLVIAVPQNTRTVFQMPRGNLETIQPRPLSLKIIGEYLNSLKYYEAFDLMRKQRINLNLIYDHNPKLFMDNINVFLESIKNNSWLNLFLSDLENEDVTRTMYSSSYTDRKNISNAEMSSKIYYICDNLRANLMQAQDSADRILPILTTFIKKNTENDLEKALTLIKELKSPVASDEALKYLLYMVNVDRLFDVALGMYDFELVLLVAAKSQKDPKEYIPMLNELNEMEESYKRFTINKHLKRFDKAVQCLAKCGPSRYEELKTFVKYHSLYREALDLFTKEDDIFKEISDDFGLYLKLKKQYIEAGVIYESAKSIDKAIECYKDALEWELVLNLAQNKSKQDLKDLCWDLASALKDEKRYTEALQMLEQICDNSEDIINFAVECAQYKTALRLCTKYNKRELIALKLLPSLINEYCNTKDLLDTNLKSFIAYRNRLQVVRDVKSKKNIESYEPVGNRDSDLYSDAGSTIASSSGSGRSFRSSKNRRKHERKVASLKEGSQYEDTALVLALHNIVTTAYEMRLPIKELNIALISLGKNREALDLQCNLETLLKEMKDSFKQIWSNKFTLEATNAAIEAENVLDVGSVIPLGIATLEPNLRIAPVIRDVQWKLEGLD